MPVNIARRVDVESACVDKRPSPKTDVLVGVLCHLFTYLPIYAIAKIFNENFKNRALKISKNFVKFYYIFFGRSQDDRRCLNGSGAASSRRDDSYRLRSVDIRSRRTAALSGITSSSFCRYSRSLDCSFIRDRFVASASSNPPCP